MSKRIFVMTASVLLVLNQFIFVGYGNGGPTAKIEFTHVPKYGSTENLRGKVLNGSPKDFAVAVYIMVDGIWWTKPYWATPRTKISNDGTWVCDITTDGVDEIATKIIAFLIPRNYEPPLASGSYRLPRQLEEISLTRVEAMRSIAGEIFITPAKRETKQIKTAGKLKGVCYGPFRDNQNPDKSRYPLLSELEEDIKFIPKVATIIRIYGSTNTLGSIPALCEKVGIDCYPGAWLGKYKTENRKEIEGIVQIASQNFKHVKALILGNEVLLRKDMTEDELIDYVKEVKKSTTLPVTTAEIWSVWTDNPGVADEVDFLTVHVHPYWEGISVNKAAEHVVKTWKIMKDVFPDKRIVIGETGWPSEGKTIGRAVPSEENQAKFLKEFTQLAEREEIEYFYFELFDEKWKSKFEGKAGAHWGIYNSDGSLKDLMKDLLPDKARKGINRPPGKISKIKVIAPLIVYSDADSGKNGFQPSGWMGDTDYIDLDQACEINPHSGKTCIRITFKPGRFFFYHGWSGIYWQYPLNNWGEYPGYELSGASKLTFWARGEKGGEKSEFKTGGISNRGKSYRDSFGPVSTGVIKLTRKWKKYTIYLENQDTGNVIGGFCWATNRHQNPKGCKIYLDDIQFEP